MLWHSHLTQNVTSQDPLADGPTIQAAGTRALAAGCTLDKVCSLDADHHIFKVDTCRLIVLGIWGRGIMWSP